MAVSLPVYDQQLAVSRNNLSGNIKATRFILTTTSSLTERRRSKVQGSYSQMIHCMGSMIPEGGLFE